MPGNIASYYLKSDGNLWVQTMEKIHRPATPNEWIQIWRFNPRLTLQISESRAAHQV
jgi:hypothetical protein